MRVGGATGASVSLIVGLLLLGITVDGACVGFPVDPKLGVTLGLALGLLVGLQVGVFVVGAVEGLYVGLIVAVKLGATLGARVGADEGAIVLSCVTITAICLVCPPSLITILPYNRRTCTE